jgi:hypothetical protein
VYEWLLRQRVAGIDDFFDRVEILSALREEGICINETKVSKYLVQLERFGYLDYKFPTKFKNWKARFRVKEKYL